MLFIFVLQGCTQNMVMNYQETGDDIITITFFGNKYESENVTVIEEILSDFMAENPGIRVSYESLKGTAYYDALRKRMAAGKGNDVFMVNHDIMLEFRNENRLADLSGLSTIPSYTAQMISQMKEDGCIYWVPTTVSAFGLYCNTGLLKEHHQKTPRNLQEWEQVCAYFKAQGVTPVIANNDISLKTLAIGRSFYPLYQSGRQKEVFDRLNCGQEKLSGYLSEGFELAETFIANGYLDPEQSLETEKTSDDLEAFAKGETPFMLTGAWAAGRVSAMNPSLSFEVVPLPVLEQGALLVMNPDTRLSVNADSPHVDAALKFVEYFTRAENIGKFADQQASFSPLKEGAPSKVKEIRGLIDCYEAGETVIGTDAFLTLPVWELTADISRKLLSGEPLAQAMSWLDQQVEAERSLRNE